MSAAKSPDRRKCFAPNLAHEVLGNSYTLPKAIATIAIMVIDGFRHLYQAGEELQIPGSDTDGFMESCRSEGEPILKEVANVLGKVN